MSIIKGHIFNYGQNIFTIKDDMSCVSMEVVYVLVCNGCNKLYIGEMDNAVSLCMNQHCSNANNLLASGLYVSKHLHAYINLPNKFKMMPLMLIKKDSSTICRYWESFIISKMKPELNA
jgi:hypothetical protein